MRENKANSNKAKSPVKRKSKFTNCGSRENQKRKKFLCDNFDEDEKEQLKKVDKKRTKCVITQRRKKKNIHKKRIKKKGKHDNLGNNQKEQLRKNEKRVKKVIHVNSGDEKRVYKKEEDKKEKIMITLMIVKKN